MDEVRSASRRNGLWTPFPDAMWVAKVRPSTLPLRKYWRSSVAASAALKSTPFATVVTLVLKFSSAESCAVPRASRAGMRPGSVGSTTPLWLVSAQIASSRTSMFPWKAWNADLATAAVPWQAAVEHAEKSRCASAQFVVACGMPRESRQGVAVNVCPTLWNVNAPVAASVTVVCATWQVAQRLGLADEPWLDTMLPVSYAKPGGIQPTLMPSTRRPWAPCAPRDVPVAPEATLQGGVPPREWQDTQRLSSVGVEIDARSCAVFGEPWGS